MKIKLLAGVVLAALILLTSCTEQTIRFTTENLELVDEVQISINDDAENAVTIAAKPMGGMALLKAVEFTTGTIDVTLRGENNPGKSFLGIAFNIQNDSTYEAIYFRPFNFKSETKKENAVQYVSQPKNTWSFLRKNFKGQYEAEYPYPPSPDDWFEIRLKIDKDKVSVYDKKSNTVLLSITRLENQVSDKIAFWTGNNSKGDFKHMTLSN